MECLNFPMIDLSKLNGDGRSVTTEMIKYACQHWGFFAVMNHGISQQLMDKVEGLVKGHYSKCMLQRFKQRLAERGLDHEAVWFEINDSDCESNLFLYHLPVTNLDDIPDSEQEYRATMLEYAVEVHKLAEQLLEVLAENLGLPKGYIKTAFHGSQGPIFGTKVSNYPPGSYSVFKGLDGYTYSGGIVLQFEDHKVSGLQLRKDDRWVDIPPLQHSILINLGDHIHVISNGRYKIGVHRTTQTYKNRMSIVSCYNAGIDAKIFPAPSLVPIDPKFELEEDVQVNNGDENFKGKRPMLL